MDNNINTLDELNKGCCMGIDALNYIMEKVEEEDFYQLLEKQKKCYEDLSNDITLLYKEYTASDIHKTNLMEKMRTWYGIQLDTMMDNSISSQADMLIQGTNMGIIEGRKLLNNKTMDKKVANICSKYVKMQEDYIEKLKDYL